MKKTLLSLLLLIASFASKAQTIDTLHSGTMIPVTFSRMYCTTSTDQVTAFVARDIYTLNGKLAIRGGELVKIEVEIIKPRVYGKPGRLRISALSTTGIDGTIILLNGSETAEGEDCRTAAWLTSCGAAILVPGIGILYGLFVKGGDACISNLPLVKTTTSVQVRVK